MSDDTQKKILDNHLNPPRIREDGNRSFFGDRLLGGDRKEDDKILDQYRKNAEKGSHYVYIDEQKYFRDQARENDGITMGYAYDSSNDLIPGTIIGEKKRINKAAKIKPTGRVKTFNDLSETPSFNELAQVSAELKSVKDAYESKGNIIVNQQQKKKKKKKYFESEEEEEIDAILSAATA